MECDTGIAMVKLEGDSVRSRQLRRIAKIGSVIRQACGLFDCAPDSRWRRSWGVYLGWGVTAMIDIHHRAIQQSSRDLPDPTKVVPFGYYGAGLSDWPSNWAGDCSRPAYHGNPRTTGSPLVSRACCSCRSHLRLLHVASPPKWTVGPRNDPPPDEPHLLTVSPLVLFQNQPKTD
jgi:hypothetical protein